MALKRFNALLDKATSDGLLETNWELNLQLVDVIRGGDVDAKAGLKAIRTRLLTTRNPSVALMTLTVLEAVVKNCGAPIQSQIATKEFMDEFVKFIKFAPPLVRLRCLEILQTWEAAFRREAKYRVVPDTYNILRVEGYEFPPVNPTGGALFMAESAPDWAEGTVCYSCRTSFTMLNRQHHCRNCGQVFCQACSSKTSTIPKFGIEKEVRVCDHCHDTLSGKLPAASAAITSGGAGGAVLSPEEEVRLAIAQNPSLAAGGSSSGAVDASRSASTSKAQAEREAQLREQEEIELALALSMSEAENKRGGDSKSAKAVKAAPVASAPAASSLYDHQLMMSAASIATAQDDPMARYLQLSQVSRQQQQPPPPQQQQQQPQVRFATPISTSAPSAPAASPAPVVVTSVAPVTYVAAAPVPAVQAAVAPSAAPADSALPAVSKEAAFLQEMMMSLSLFEQKLQRAQTRGGGVTGDAAVQSLFRNLTSMHPQLMAMHEEADVARQNAAAVAAKQQAVVAARARAAALEQQHHARLEDMRREQEALQRIQLEQKMALIAQQQLEQQAHQRALEQQRQQALLEEQAREQERERQRALAAFEKEQERLMQQQAELDARRQLISQQQQQQQQFRPAAVQSPQQQTYSPAYVPASFPPSVQPQQPYQPPYQQPYQPPYQPPYPPPAASAPGPAPLAFQQPIQQQQQQGPPVNAGNYYSQGQPAAAVAVAAAAPSSAYPPQFFGQAQPQPGAQYAASQPQQLRRPADVAGTPLISFD